MSLLAPWLLFPAVLGALALGCGLLLERATGARMSGALLAPVGLAVIVVVAGVTTLSATTATLTVPVVVALAAAGLACSLERGKPHGAISPLVTAAVVFCAYAAPVVMSGEATFAGYIKLDDTATFLALTDRVMEQGHSLAGLAPSSYEATLWVNLAHGYPVGALLPFGIARELTGVDGAWVYQPYLAFLAAMLALVLYALAARALQSARLRAVAAGVAAQPALLYGFALWGGIKELAAAPLVALVAAVAPTSVEELSRPRRVVPAAVAMAAVLGVLSVGGAVWLLVPAAVLLVLATRGRRIAARIGGCLGAIVLLSIPTLLDARSFLSAATEEAVRSGTVLGNLVRPLSSLQVLGVWPTSDFRLDPQDLATTRILLAVVAVAALTGCVFLLRQRSWPPLLYTGCAIIGCVLIGTLGSPWVVAKAYTIASPAFLFAAVMGCAGLISRRRRTEGILALTVVAGGVLWSNVLAYHGVNLAPRAQLAELEWIGHRFAGQGPALMTEYQPYGVRHFLRAVDAEGASELRRRQIPLRNGAMLEKGAYADLAEFQPSAVGIYRTLILRRSPLASRPPAIYQLVWRGRFYDVWSRTQESVGAGARRCDASRALTSLSRSRSGSAEVVLALSRVDHPATWPAAAGRQLVYPTGPGVVRAQVGLPATGRYSVWVGGSFRNRLAALVDGREIGAQSDQLNNSGQYTRLGTATLAAGVHDVELRYSRSVFTPGSGGPEYGFGPLVVSRDEARC